MERWNIKRNGRKQELIDYSCYRLSLYEEVRCAGVSFFLAALAAWLLYKHAGGLILCVFIFPMHRRNYRNERILSRKKRLLWQFKDAMQCVSVAILSGFSIENAWIEAESELEELYGQSAEMVEEMRQMNRGIRMNQPVEQQLFVFAERTHCEDIMEFAEVFRFAKRNGGNFGKIIQSTVKRIGERMEVEREIETIIAGKKMEQKVMNIIPVCLLAYLNISSEEFLAPLYGNVFGVCVMTIAFAVYLMALMLAQKMVDIKV